MYISGSVCSPRLQKIYVLFATQAVQRVSAKTQTDIVNVIKQCISPTLFTSSSDVLPDSVEVLATSATNIHHVPTPVERKTLF